MLGSCPCTCNCLHMRAHHACVNSCECLLCGADGLVGDFQVFQLEPLCHVSIFCRGIRVPPLCVFNHQQSYQFLQVAGIYFENSNRHSSVLARGIRSLALFQRCLLRCTVIVAPGVVMMRVIVVCPSNNKRDLFSRVRSELCRTTW